MNFVSLGWLPDVQLLALAGPAGITTGTAGLAPYGILVCGRAHPG